PAGAFDPSGSLVSADHPVAVFAGNRFLRLQPAPQPGGEATHQQMPPAAALGHEYAAAPFATRRADLAPEVITYRLVGAYDGTTLTFDPAVTGGAATLSQGQVLDVQSSAAFRVYSQDAMHPFSLAQLMGTANVTGGSRPGATDTHYPLMLGDEEHTLVVPPAQFLSRYVFFTDPTYATTNLVITRVAVSGAFQNVEVDCLGVVTGWQPVGTDGRFQVTNVDLVRAGVGVGTCMNGRHTAQSAAPFGIVVWGEDTYSSYAYPAGGNAASLATLNPLIPPG
ncbi:MAG: IgGFc-binding protein, partial [Deltaproteobacteria bacterium]